MNIKNRVILVLLLSTLGIAFFSLNQHSSKVDIFRTKNNHIDNSIITSIKETDSIFLLKQEAIRLVNLKAQSSYETSQFSLNQIKILIVQSILILGSIILVLFKSTRKE